MFRAGCDPTCTFRYIDAATLPYQSDSKVEENKFPSFWIEQRSEPNLTVSKALPRQRSKQKLKRECAVRIPKAEGTVACSKHV